MPSSLHYQILQQYNFCRYYTNLVGEKLITISTIQGKIYKSKQDLKIAIPPHPNRSSILVHLRLSED